MSNDRLRKKRARAEARFRFYGIMGLSLATLALLLLLGIVVSRALPAFQQTQIRVEVQMPPATSEPVAWRSVLRDSLAKQLNVPEAERKRLLPLLSDDVSFTVKRYFKEHPGAQAVTLWLTAGDAVDRYLKTPPEKRDSDTGIRLNPMQRQWVQALLQRNAVKRVFNRGFFTRGDSRQPEQAGFASSMMGSFFTLLVCLGVAFPLGLMTAVYLEEFAPKNKLVDFIEVNINNLAAVPSIVFGLLGLAIYLNLFGMPRSAPLAGGLTLALMILPTIIIATRASIKAVPDSIRNAARGLGASPVQVVFHHVVPMSVPGIMTGTILGLARAIGETAPLLLIGMVAFVADVPHRFTDPATAMPVQIYLWASTPEASFVEKTAAGILVLLAILLTLNAAAIMIRRKFEGKR
jgi:phosphate transport system permease protein